MHVITSSPVDLVEEVVSSIASSIHTILMFAFAPLLKAHNSLGFSKFRTSVSIYRNYAAMATDPKKYSLNRR